MAEELIIIVEPPVRTLEVIEEGPQGPAAVTGISFFVSGKPLAGEVLNRHLSVGSTPLSADLSFVALAEAPTADWSLGVYVDDELVATGTVEAGELVGPFTFEDDFTGLAHLETAVFVAPAIQDADAAGVSVTMQTPLET